MPLSALPVHLHVTIKVHAQNVKLYVKQINRISAIVPSYYCCCVLALVIRNSARIVFKVVAYNQNLHYA